MTDLGRRNFNLLKSCGRPALLIFILMALASFSRAADKEHGTVIQDATIYVSPDTSSQRLGQATRGRDISLVMERSTFDNKLWAHVLVVVAINELTGQEREVSGWINADKLITPSTPNADQIIFGEAVDSEKQAEQRGGRRHAAEDAMRLYYRLWEYFPSSPLAGEALWRAADIRWQLEKQGIIARPSYQRLSPEDRAQMDEEMLKMVIKKFPHSKWADLASYDLIDNKICGNWKGDPKCPEKEAELYEHYAHEHPQSPKASEAAYNAAWRTAALVDIYKAVHEQEKSENARRKAIALAQQLTLESPQGDWKPRALDLIFKLQQGVPVYEANANAAAK